MRAAIKQPQHANNSTHRCRRPETVEGDSAGTRMWRSGSNGHNGRTGPSDFHASPVLTTRTMVKPVADSPGEKDKKSASQNLWVRLPNLASHHGDSFFFCIPQGLPPLTGCECGESKGVRDEGVGMCAVP
jgi:hypothetical protein